MKNTPVDNWIDDIARSLGMPDDLRVSGYDYMRAVHPVTLDVIQNRFKQTSQNDVTPPVEAVELEEVLVKLLHKHDHEPDAITKYVVIDQTEFVPSAIQVIMEALQTEITKARWTSPVDLNDPEYMLQFIDDPIEKFNMFIKKWCPNYPHLIDSDDNDGQEIRDMIAQLKGQSDV